MSDPRQEDPLIESQWHPLDIGDEDAATLAVLGRQLAGKSAWWGDDASTGNADASAIHVRSAGAGRWSVRVVDAIGVISVAGRTLPVAPKIPPTHALGLLEIAEAIPRTTSAAIHVGHGLNLFELVARWLVSATQEVLRGDLIRDYQTRQEDLQHVRGRVEPYRTSVRLLKGRVDLPCEYDDLDINNPLNRVLLAGVLAVAKAPFAQEVTRNQATRLIKHFQGVSPLAVGDLAVAVTPRTWYYRNALSLAKMILTGTALSLTAGASTAGAFLIRTPEAIEAGIRRLLQDALVPDHSVTKQGIQLSPSPKTLNPDLVFDGGLATGDVKYQLQAADWDTAHLYQAVTFATGYRSHNALVITFSLGAPPLPPLIVGDVRVTNLIWDARSETTFDEATIQLVESAHSWLRAATPATHLRPLANS